MVEREPGLRNDAVAWSKFDADEYWKLNFADVLPEDAAMGEGAGRGDRDGAFGLGPPAGRGRRCGDRHW